MKNPDRRKRAAALSLCSLALGYACHGTETDNPIVENPPEPPALGPLYAGNSPQSFTAPQMAPPCPWVPVEALPYLPTGLADTLAVSTPAEDLIAIADGDGLTLLDASTPSYASRLGGDA